MKLTSNLVTTLLMASLLFACGGSSSSNNGENSTPTDEFSVRLDLPDSLTGGKFGNRQIASKIAEMAGRGGSDQSCNFLGPENESDPFRNGYETSRYLISIMATWTCIADLLIGLSDVKPRDGLVIETANDTASPNYEADKPTHYSVTDEFDTQVSLRLYYGYPRSAAPQIGESAQFFIAWNRTSSDELDGRLIIDTRTIDSEQQSSDDPVMMRMDFDFNAGQRMADMYLRFDHGNPWAEGFRIQVTRDDTANLLGQVFIARGLVEMKRQFLTLPTVSEVPQVQFFTVTDWLGNGATIEEIRDLSLPLMVNFFRGNHLGDYLFTKRDVYFFEDDQDWEYIDKTVISSQYRGARTTLPSGGSWDPFNPSLDMIIAALNLDSDTFTGNKCAQLHDDCNQLLNAAFAGGFAGQEQNQGSDPMDWRSEAVANATYLASVYPNGISWSGAFAQQYTPVP